MADVVTRFAPSPTGPLHLGHAFAALFAEKQARAYGGRFVLRIEDIDPRRSKAEFETAIFDDLKWLELEWEEPVVRQSERMTAYAMALQTLAQKDLVYPCFCTRKEIEAEIKNAGHAPHPGEPGGDGSENAWVYPGTCRNLGKKERGEKFKAGTPYALRLDVLKAMVLAEHENGGKPLTWLESLSGLQACDPSPVGDIVLARKDTPTSYHLAVVLDDHFQGVTLVTRGHDLLPSTHVHRVLQAALGLTVPRYQHHKMVTDENGKYLSKRDEAHSLKQMRDDGLDAQAIRAMLDLRS